MNINDCKLQVLKVNWFLEKYIFLFLFYGLMGWLFEVSWVFFFFGSFQNCGFLNSTFIPIYGIGAILITLLIKDRYSIIRIFIIGFVIATGIEFITSVLFDKLFNVLLWDYSCFFINVNGRISLITSFLFGVGAIIIVKFINPILDKIIRRFKYNNKFDIILSIFLLIIFIDFLWNLSKLIIN